MPFLKIKESVQRSLKIANNNKTENRRFSVFILFYAKMLSTGGLKQFRCRSRDRGNVGVQAYAREPERG